ncbi:hypothetical protein SDC49_05015 [Lactobacillus sp. R2/2]|nr:hypothetical protein [Lactobacillus sp. R2/2]
MQSVKKIINELSLEEKAILTAGHSEWETNRIKDKVYGIFLSDGSFGLRKQSGPGDHLGISASEPATCFPQRQLWLILGIKNSRKGRKGFGNRS